ncbi:MAG TPA: hypothetical protein VMM92_00465 [Thermoanaerobaculia bacterium]|nr:hypothetical protein [Thermoanaerobaculia bacterium]
MASLQGEIDLLKARIILEDDIVNRTRDLAEQWLRMDLPEKRAVVESFVDRITVEKEQVTIDLVALPPLSEIMAKGPYRHCAK